MGLETERPHLALLNRYTERANPLQQLGAHALSLNGRHRGPRPMNSEVQRSAEHLIGKLLIKLPQDEVRVIRFLAGGIDTKVCRDEEADANARVWELWQVEEVFVQPLANELSIQHIPAFVDPSLPPKLVPQEG